MIFREIESFPEPREAFPEDMERRLRYLELLSKRRLDEMRRQIREEIENRFGIITLEDDLRLSLDPWRKKYGEIVRYFQKEVKEVTQGSEVTQESGEKKEKPQKGFETERIEKSMQRVGGLTWTRGESLEFLLPLILNIYLDPKEACVVRSPRYDDILRGGGKRGELPSPDIYIIVPQGLKVKGKKPQEGEIAIFAIDFTLVKNPTDEEMKSIEEKAGNDPKELNKELWKKLLERCEKFEKVENAIIRNNGINVRFGIIKGREGLILSNPNKPLKIPILTLPLPEDNFYNVVELIGRGSSPRKVNIELGKNILKPFWGLLTTEIDVLCENSNSRKWQVLQPYQKEIRLQTLNNLKGVIVRLGNKSLKHVLEIKEKVV